VLHLKDELQRNQLMNDASYRRWFRKNYEKRFGPRVWQRDFHDAHIVGCPDASIIGKTFGEVADARGIHPVDCFLDLVVAHGRKLRWRTLIANHRPHRLKKIVQDQGAILSFSDAGAHIRNMAFYNFPLRLLKLVRDAEEQGRPFMSVEKAVWRLTGELADWFDIDAGHLRLGDRADLVIVDPQGLDDSLGAYAEAPIAEFNGLMRMVNRNDAAVVVTGVGGAIVFRDGQFREGYGTTVKSGRYLRAGAGYRQLAGSGA